MQFRYKSIVMATILMLLLGQTSMINQGQAAGVFHSVEGILTAFFPNSKRISYQVVETKTHAAALKTMLGYTPKRKNYVVFVGLSDDQIDGFAVIDNENGRFDPITFAIKFSPKGQVERTEVIVYRGPRGDEIMDPTFMEQFVGKTLDDPLKPNLDIDTISGATISSKATVRAVKRAAALVEIVSK